MNNDQQGYLQTARVLQSNQDEILQNWINAQLNDNRIQGNLFAYSSLGEESQEFIEGLVYATVSGNLEDIETQEYDPLKQVLARISKNREDNGFTPFETAFSIISFKDSWVPFLQATYKDDLDTLNSQVIIASKLIDSLGLITFYEWSRRREEVISRQSREILEISTPVVQMWEGIVVAPLIGTLDTQRAQQFTERLLEFIVETRSLVALVDITGVISVDTRTAQHLIEAITAAKLLGTQVVLTGVSPIIAQTLVHLRIGLGDIVTKASLAAGLRYALDILNLEVVKREHS